MTSQTPEEPAVEDTWPLPVYDNGPPKHVHAIGVIALTYATLQSAMDHLFLNRARSEWAEKYYYGLSEDKRSEAIKDIFKDDDDPGVAQAIGNLAEYFDWCRDCRNNILHAERYPSGLLPFPGGALGLAKRSKKGTSGYMALTLQEFRDVADRMQEGIVQSAKIDLFVRYRDRPEGLAEQYRAYARSLPLSLSIPKRLALASSPQDLREDSLLAELRNHPQFSASHRK
jgi:hypothetical protein